tara:strand:+ start:25269 stop:26399 length:1131 start_codon:yes stop_codon:yes gene_type:complete
MATEYQQVGTEVKYREETQTFEQDLGYETVSICKPKFIFFEMVGLRPSTPHWVFFDGIEVTKWVNTSFNLESYNNAPINSLLRNPGDNYITATSFPAAQGGPTNAAGPISTDASGTLSGAFYLQSNEALSFKTGTKKLTAIDVSILDKQKALSYAEGQFVSTGVYEVYYEESVTTNVAYDAPIYDWVTVPDPVPPANTSSDNDRGGQTMVTVLGHDGYNYYVTQSHADQMGYGVGNHGAKKTNAAGQAYVNSSGSSSGGGAASNAENSKIVCTAMNNAYGFGSYRQAIWLKYSEGMSKEHEVGYHAIFMPLVDKAYNRGDKNNMLLRKILEHIARHRTADIRAETQGRKRDTVGRIERAFFEPLCYIVGKIKMRKQ